MEADTIDKITKSYFAAVTKKPFTYKGERYGVPTLTVSPGLLRGYTCPIGCGGCCGKFTLDYLPSESRPYGMAPREIDFDGRTVQIFTDRQKSNNTDRCSSLERGTGRCMIHGVHPFSCDFELIRVMHRREHNTAHMTQRLFARGWNMKRADGGRGSLCEITPADPSTVAEVIRKLGRLEQWAQHFGIPTRISTIISWASSIADAPERYPDLVLKGAVRA